jgi:hypothetical protein
MSTATYTIDAIHFTPPAPSGADSEDPQDCQGRVDQAAHPALHLADSGHGLVISVALGAILCVSQVQQWSKMTAGQRQTFDPTACSLFGVVFVGAVLLAALGVRAMTAEYVTGMIRSTFAATPTRRRVLAAKAGGHCGVRVPGGAAHAVVSFEVGQRSSPASTSKCPSLIPASSKRWSSVPWR